MSDNQGSAEPAKAQSNRFAVCVDGQAKAAFDDRASAEARADQIRQKHPRVLVEVVDRESRDIVERRSLPVGEAVAIQSTPSSRE